MQRFTRFGTALAAFALAACATISEARAPCPSRGTREDPGTLFGRWDEATFFNELMTGFLNSSASANPLSDLSVASMGDLGYVVNLGTGDRYRLPSTPGPALTASAVAGQGPGLDLKGRERLLKPSP